VSDEVITAKVANDELVRMTNERTEVVAEQLAVAEAAYEAASDAIITKTIETKKTFWTRRTRTRDEAIAYLNSQYPWGWCRQEEREVLNAKRDLYRLAEIRDLAHEPNFQNITLTESDLRLVGGLSD
jgi:hypothetical protein